MELMKQAELDMVCDYWESKQADQVLLSDIVHTLLWLSNMKQSIGNKGKEADLQQACIPISPIFSIWRVSMVTQITPKI